MKNLLVLILFVLVLSSNCHGEQSKSKEILNQTNFASYFHDYLGFEYDSHGCLHFSPSDIYLLYKTIPIGTRLTIKSYSIKSTDFDDNKLVSFNAAVMDEQDLKKYADLFRSRKVSLVVYPALSRLYIYIDRTPFLKMFTHPGPAEEYLILENVEKGKPVLKDFMRVTPTDSGNFKIYEKTDHYLSATYAGITQIQFGLVLEHLSGVWKYKSPLRWVPAPQFIQDDLAGEEKNRYYNYFDPIYDKNGNLATIRWGGNDFGKYAITWTKDGRSRYPELGYCAGQLLYEQYSMVGQIAGLLTTPGLSDFDGLVKRNYVFSAFKNTNDFVSTSGREGKLLPEEEAIFRLYHGIALTQKDKTVLDPRLIKAYNQVKTGLFPRNQSGRREALSLYNYLRVYNEIFNKQAKWYKKLKDDWSFWGELREALVLDFDKGGLAQEKRKKVVEGWINDRLEFRTIK